MPRKILKNEPVTGPQVRHLLESLGRELNQFQRKTLEYAVSFSKVSSEDAEKLVSKLAESFGIDVMEAVQIVNCMPETVEELRVFLPRHKLIETAKLKEIVQFLDQHRK